jgi:hypothetical protein
MRYLIGAILVSLALWAAPAKAQDALVVQTCGTLPLAYSPGATRLVTVDTTGKLCSSNNGAIVTGTTTITGCGAINSILYNNNGVVGCDAGNLYGGSSGGVAVTFDLNSTAAGAATWNTNASGTKYIWQTNGTTKLDFNSTIATTWNFANNVNVAVGGQIKIADVGATHGLQLVGNNGSTNVVGTLGANEPLALRTNSAARVTVTDTTASFTGPFVSTGTAPTSTTGTCAIVAGTRLGGSSAGSFTIPVANCAIGTTVIFTAMPAVTNGYTCNMHDQTTVAAVFNQTGALSTTGATFTIAGAQANGSDLVSWDCHGF